MCYTADVTVVTTQYDSECVILRDTSFHHHQLRMNWIQMAVSYVGLLSYALQFSCGHLGEVYHCIDYATLATQYKILCISAIKEAIGAQDCSARNPVVATIISLALDEVSICALIFIHIYIPAYIYRSSFEREISLHPGSMCVHLRKWYNFLAGYRPLA